MCSLLNLHCTGVHIVPLKRTALNVFSLSPNPSGHGSVCAGWPSILIGCKPCPSFPPLSSRPVSLALVLSPSLSPSRSVCRSVCLCVLSLSSASSNLFPSLPRFFSLFAATPAAVRCSMMVPWNRTAPHRTKPHRSKTENHSTRGGGTCRPRFWRRQYNEDPVCKALSVVLGLLGVRSTVDPSPPPPSGKKTD